MKLTHSLLEQTAVYSLWQSPFAKQKFAPILRQTNLQTVRSVLDVGCGPGTNAALFANTGYLGIDINPRYVESAKKKYGRNFLVADVTTYTDIPAEKFDFILINSFLHHIDDAGTNQILARLRDWLSGDGFIHVLELVYPANFSVAQLVAKADRGKFSRPLDHWRSLFERHLDIQVFEPYPLKGFGVTLWNMVYCKGRPR
jgi:SAM-dependent methyltransferase